MYFYKQIKITANKIRRTIFLQKQKKKRYGGTLDEPDGV